MIRFGPEICTNLDDALSREWLETNGLGGFASAAICGASTRRYHGLLVAAMRPPLSRMVLLSKLEETLSVPAGVFELATNLFPGVVHPQGYRLLEEFRLDPWPVWRWNAGGVRIEKSVCLLQDESTVVVEYRLLDPGEAALDVRPLIAFRDYHATAHVNDALRPDVAQSGGMAAVQPYSDLPPLHFLHTNAQVTVTGHWYLRFQYPRERERGLDWEEDLFQPFAMRFALTAEHPVHIVASLGDPPDRGAAALMDEERARRKPSSADLVPALERASGQFLAERGQRDIVIAGYHWFTDWGRDTMIALPGLALEMHRPYRARRTLSAYAPMLHRGLLPNRCPDGGEPPEYNSADATLWFVETLRAYFAQTGDAEFIRSEWLPELKGIVAWREHGTIFGIRVDSDGLLMGGEPGVQLTWMDAKVNGRVVTQRDGKPVEIQALWYNALRVIADFAEMFGDAAFARECRETAGRARTSFERQFWNEDAGCLFDVVQETGRDTSIRPNQLFALSLPHRIFEDAGRSALVIEAVRRELLTPFGLRTLSPRDPRYQGRYGGSQESRDEAYHQGTVWPWLLGPYVSALFAVHGKNAATVAEARQILEPFRAHLLEAGVGQVSEVFDGDPPHAPGGCIAQAWSVAELLRIARQLD